MLYFFMVKSNMNFNYLITTQGVVWEKPTILVTELLTTQTLYDILQTDGNELAHLFDWSVNFFILIF